MTLVAILVLLLILVLAIPVAYLVRMGLAEGFRTYELAGFGAALALILCFAFWGIPTGLGATLILGALVLRRAGPWWRQPVAGAVAAPA